MITTTVIMITIIISMKIITIVLLLLAITIIIVIIMETMRMIINSDDINMKNCKFAEWLLDTAFHLFYSCCYLFVWDSN